MSTERNKAIVRRLFDDVWNTGSLDRIEELYAADFVADYRPYAPLRHHTYALSSAGIVS
jgi:ketosteroid isomerase-like protein